MNPAHLASSAATRMEQMSHLKITDYADPHRIQAELNANLVG